MHRKCTRRHDLLICRANLGQYDYQDGVPFWRGLLASGFTSNPAEEISSAIMAETNLIMAPGMTIGMSVQLALSPEGSFKSFDASADGYARGEDGTVIM